MVAHFQSSCTVIPNEQAEPALRASSNEIGERGSEGKPG